MSVNKRPRDLGLIISIGLLLIGLISIFIPFNIFDGINVGKFYIHIGKYNELGDFISGITAPFLSIAAFVLLYLTYSSQKKELQESRTILKNQNELINKQQFENTFFNFINLHNQIVNQIEITITQTSKTSKGTTENRTILKGHDCFVRTYENFRLLYQHLSANQAKMKTPIYPDKKDFINAVFIEFFKDRYSSLGHYYKNLYQIVRFVDNANISNKSNYTDIIRAQLSTNELLMLCIYCLSNGKEEFKPLVEKYSLLKDIAENPELLRYDCKDLYDKKAFEAR